MNKLKTEELALILHGLRSIHVSDLEATRAKLETKVEGYLRDRGVMLPKAA
jgi:hypothetical protein